MVLEGALTPLLAFDLPGLPARSLSSQLSAHLLVPQLCHLPQQTVVCLFLSVSPDWMAEPMRTG